MTAGLLTQGHNGPRSRGPFLDHAGDVTPGNNDSARTAAAGATLAAYSIGLSPFVTIRSAVASFSTRKNAATPVKASLTA